MIKLCRTKTPGLLHAKLLWRATLKIYPGYLHGMMSSHAEVLNADLLKFTRD